MNEKPQLPTCLLNRIDNEEDKPRYDQYFFTPATKAIRKLLVEELMSRRERSVQKGDNPEKFSLPSWPAYQANEVGYRRALKEMIDLLSR